LELAGTYDAGWEKTKKPLLPDDYDEQFGMSAPADQRFPKPLRGGETVTIVNMTPEGALRFDLPQISLGFRSVWGQRAEAHEAILASVLVALDEKKLSLVWQTSLRVSPRQVEQLDRTEISERPR
jgi:hypothetical protein